MTPLTPTPKGCGKIPYDSRKDAEKAMRCVVSRRGQKTPSGLHAYACRHCGQIHIGRKWL